MKFCVKIMYANGKISYLSHKDRTAWSRRTALKHLREFMARLDSHTRLEIAGCSLEFA